ncbi:ABC transporter substrate-binding protein [Chthonobacter rhizosphaerae]|uniref:ABC transporter substrate-binding protein n=1 Tax=Chthonobacter rhizosphaerae TaxID=2735553 RepID=UPI0015EF749E|nr:ABC transporter substrate-binding protein [Chthonobacter rhizosphaerae]
MPIPPGTARPVRPSRAAAVVLAGLLAAGLAAFAGPARAETLVIAGSTDRSAMEPLIAGFRAANPDVELAYVERDTVALFAAVVDGALDPAPDVVISSAADLQIRLANDGHSRPYRSNATARLPEWARWRDEAFGFTFEPLVFVTNPSLLPGDAAPRTRAALADLIRSRPDLKGRVATYDVATSGVGYLLSSIDSILMSDYWPFVAEVSEGGLLTFCCTSDVIDAVADGRAAVGYNVLGSYAWARQAAGTPIDILYPEDFMTVVSRVALLTRTGESPRAAERFLDWLLSADAQRVLAHEALLSAIDDRIADGLGQTSIRDAAQGPIRPIGLNAQLLAMTDPLRRARFIALWTSVVRKP